MMSESTRMKKMVSDLLLLAKLDRASEIHLSQTKPDEVINEMEPHLSMLAGQRKLRLDLTIGLQAMVDPDKLKQVILNVFHNAVVHTDPEQGMITIKLRSNEGSGVIDIMDRQWGRY